MKFYNIAKSEYGSFLASNAFWGLKEIIARHTVIIIIILIFIALFVFLFAFLAFWRILFPVSWYIRIMKTKLINNHTRRLAAETLGTLNNIKAVEPLISALIDDDSDIRYSAANSLGTLGDKRAIEPLIDLLNDHWDFIRRSAAEALRKLNVSNKKLVEGYLKALQSVNYIVRGSSAGALGTLRDKRAVKPLLLSLNDESGHVRGSAADALGTLGDKRAVEPLIDRLSDDSSYVRSSVAKALGALGDKRAVEPLIDRLSDDELNVCNSVAKALGTIGDKRAVKPLIHVLNNWNVRLSALKALEFLGEKREVEMLITLLISYDKNVRISAYKALMKLDVAKEKLLEGYLKALQSTSYEVRRFAIEKLGTLDDDKVVELLLSSLSDNDWGVRISAIKALGNLGDKRAIEPLVATLFNNDWRTRSSSLRSGLTLDYKRDARICVAEAIAKIGDPIALSGLERVLTIIPPTFVETDTLYYQDIIIENPEYKAIKLAISKLEEEKEDILPDVKEWKLILSPKLPRFRICNTEDILVQLLERSWLWNYAVDNVGRDNIILKIEDIKTKVKRLIKTLRKEKVIVKNKEIISVYLHGSYVWLSNPNDIDIFIVLDGTNKYTYFPNKLLVGRVGWFLNKSKMINIGEHILKKNISLNIELIGIETLIEAIEKKEEKVTRSILIARRRAILLYGCILLGGTDLYMNSNPPIKNFSILRDDLLKDAQIANWPDIKCDKSKISAKKQWRYFEVSCIEKMFNIESN